MIQHVGWIQYRYYIAFSMANGLESTKTIWIVFPKTISHIVLVTYCCLWNQCHGMLLSPNGISGVSIMGRFTNYIASIISHNHDWSGKLCHIIFSNSLAQLNFNNWHLFAITWAWLATWSWLCDSLIIWYVDSWAIWLVDSWIQFLIKYGWFPDYVICQWFRFLGYVIGQFQNCALTIVWFFNYGWFVNIIWFIDYVIC